MGSPLVLKETKQTGFAIAGEDGVFQWGEVSLEGNKVTVSNPSIPNPKTVRYAWAGNPFNSLYNEAGLPAPLFTTDSAAIFPNFGGSTDLPRKN